MGNPSPRTAKGANLSTIFFLHPLNWPVKGYWYNEFIDNYLHEKVLDLNFAQRIPKLEQLVPVYAVIVAMIYPWSLLRFFWRLSSWLYFSTVGEIAVIFTYMMVVNLIETILVLLAPVLMSILLPQKWFYDKFITKGSLLILLGLGYLMYFDNHLSFAAPFPLDLVYWTPAIAAAILALVFLLGWIGFLGKILNELANRLTIFLYISIPVSLISLLVVLVRNIF